MHRKDILCDRSSLVRALHLLHDNGVLESSLVKSLRRVSQLLGWEASLQLIWPRSSWAGCINERPDVTHGVLKVKPSDHASAVRQP